MGKVRLTAPKVEAFTCPLGKDQAFLWDTESPGLAGRATAGGSRAFILQSRFMGKPLRMTIGEATVWPLNNRMDRVGPGGRVLQAGAREEARRLQASIDADRDPRAVKAESSTTDLAARAAERRQAVLVREAWAAYLADRKPHRGTRHYDDHVDLAHPGGEAWKRGSDKSRKTKPGPLAELLPEKLDRLGGERLETWAAREAKVRPSRARLSLRLVKAFLGWCATQKEYRDAVHVEAAKSKRVREKLGTPAKQNAVLQREQLQAWFTAVRAIPNPLISAYLQMMILAGPRPNEPLWLKWQYINFQWKTITIRDKVEGDRVTMSGCSQAQPARVVG